MLTNNHRIVHGTTPDQEEAKKSSSTTAFPSSRPSFSISPPSTKLMYLPFRTWSMFVTNSTATPPPRPSAGTSPTLPPRGLVALLPPPVSDIPSTIQSNLNGSPSSRLPNPMILPPTRNPAMLRTQMRSARRKSRPRLPRPAHANPLPLSTVSTDLSSTLTLPVLWRVRMPLLMPRSTITLLRSDWARSSAFAATAFGDGTSSITSCLVFLKFCRVG